MATANFVTPTVDIYESAEDVVLLADLPGVMPDALNVKVERNALVIEAPRGDGATYKRTFEVPAIFDTSKIDAALKHGVLTLKLPRAEAAKPRRIDIRSA